MQEEKTFSKTRRLVPLPSPLPQDHTHVFIKSPQNLFLDRPKTLSFFGDNFSKL